MFMTPHVLMAFTRKADPAPIITPTNPPGTKKFP